MECGCKAFVSLSVVNLEVSRQSRMVRQLDRQDESRHWLRRLFVLIAVPGL
jgi:hypothetical protein